MSDIRIIVDNTIAEPYKAEHGLSLAVFHRKERILFDTGAGAAIRHNLACAALTPQDFTKLVLSHGHYDHSGGIAEILPEMTDAEIYLAPGADITRFSRHEGRGVRDLSMRQDAKDLLATRGFNPIYGARPLKRTIRQMIENPLSKEILAQNFKAGDTVLIDVNDDEIVFKK